VELMRNPYRGRGLPRQSGLAAGTLSADPSEPQTLLCSCPAASPTQLRDEPGLAADLGVGALYLKDESTRMGLGSFKALGAAYVIARDAVQAMESRGQSVTTAKSEEALKGRIYACASAGNHGLSMAAGARIFGATAIVYLARTVPEAFADRLRGYGARVVRAGEHYEASMAAVAHAADENGWTLLSDSSWPGYTAIPTRVMEGYLVMGAEVVDQILQPPTHVFLQAGVGGLAAAMSALFRRRWGDEPTLIVVEPAFAPALMKSIDAGSPVKTRGPASIMGRLDCKEPSHLALAELARGADVFLTITDEEGRAAATLLADNGIPTTPSGAAGFAGLLHSGPFRETLGITGQSRVLAFVSEGPEKTP